MKKIVSFILVLIIIVSFAACNTDGSSSSKNGDGPKVTLFADKEAVAPGDEVVVFVNVDKAENAACFEVFVTADSELEYVDCQGIVGETGLFIECNKQEENGQEGYLIAVIHMQAYTLNNYDVAALTFKVPEDMKTGKSLKFGVSCLSFDLATDESGAEIYSVLDSLSLADLKIKTAEESVAAQARHTASSETTAEATTAEETTVEETTSDEETTVEEETASDEENTDEALSVEETSEEVAEETEETTEE